MRNISIVVLVVAALLGGMAVLGVRALLLSSSQQQAQASMGSELQLSTVVVATAYIAFGAELTADMFREASWAEPQLPTGAFGTVGEILDGEQRVALRAIPAGQLILDSQISGTGERAALSQFIGQGMRAVSIRVNEVTGAAGFILPGDYVDVLLTVDATSNPFDAATHVILQNVRVLAIDQIADESRGGAFVAKVATLEVTIENGQRIALAQSIGNISLALRNIMGDADGEPVRTINFRDLQPNRESPDTQGSRNSNYTTMMVTRELNSSRERVYRDRVGTPQGADVSAHISGAQE